MNARLWEVINREDKVTTNLSENAPDWGGGGRNSY